MISYVKIKPTADKAKNWVKGVCTSDDTKPIDGIANGSKLLELDTGKRCVYDEGQTKWIEYGTGEDRSGGGTKVTTETISGPMKQLFAGWSKTKFDQLYADINNGRASARVRIQTGESYFDAQIMPSGTDELSVLNTSMFTPVGYDPSFLIVAITYYYFSDEESIIGLMNYYNHQNGWVLITDEELSRTTGQSSYDLVITRIEEE